MKGGINTKLLAFYILVVIVAAYFYPRKKNWTPSFSKEHHWPFGCEILYESLDDLFPSSNVEINDKTLFESEGEFEDGNMNLVFIQDVLNMDSLDTDVLLEQVEGGSTAFISAQRLPRILLDTLGLSKEGEIMLYDVELSGFSASQINHGFYDQNVMAADTFSCPMIGLNYYLTSEDSLSAPIGLAWSGDTSKVSFISKPFGKGRIFIHTQPFLFTNYYILSDGGPAYIQALFSYLPNNNILWDEYYKPANGNKRKDILGVVKSFPALKWALYLILSGGILFLLFMSKRKQRIIPELDAFSNESVEFIETIGQLYFNTSDNKEISMKKVRIFKNLISRRYGIQSSTNREDYIERLHRKTLIEKTEISQTLKLMDIVKDQVKVSDAQLKVLNSKINKILNA